MRKLLVLPVVLLCFINVGDAKQLPSFITACYRDDPNLHNCLLKESKKSLKKFVAGIPELDIEPMDPLKLGDFDVLTPSGNLKIYHKNAITKGFKDFEIIDLNINLQKRTGLLRMRGNATFKSNYSVSGRILVFPITGQGLCKMKIYNLDMTLKWNWETFKKDGKEYAHMTDARNTHTIDHASVRLDGLFNNNKALGDAMNEIINTNWRVIYEDVGPPSIDVIQKKVIEVMNKFYEQIPYEDLIPKKNPNKF